MRVTHTCLLSGVQLAKESYTYVLDCVGFRMAKESSHTCNAARPEAIANGKGHVILRADVQDVIPVHICKFIAVVQQTQLQQQKLVTQGWALASHLS